MKRLLAYKNEWRIACSDIGEPNGFPILVQHGMVASIDDAALFDHLVSCGMRVISLARPGYGESPPIEMKNVGEWGEIVAGLIDQLGVDRFDVLGISSGAPYAYSIANALPEKVRSVYILSGIPALYDESVAAQWPYPVDRNATLKQMRSLARDLFFTGLAEEDLLQNDVRDSMMNDCYGPAQDLRIRGMDWGFRLQDLKTRVVIQHSSEDNLATAQLTAGLLPNCELIVHQGSEHFSRELLNNFFDRSIRRELT